MRKKKGKLLDSKAGRKAAKKFSPERLAHYRSIREKNLSDPSSTVKTSYSDMTDNELKKEAKSKAVDSVALLLTDFRLYMAMMCRGLLEETFEEENG